MIEGLLFQELSFGSQTFERSMLIQMEYLETLEPTGPYLTLILDDPQEKLDLEGDPSATVTMALDGTRAKILQENVSFQTTFSLLKISTLPNFPRRYKLLFCPQAHRDLLLKKQILLASATPAQVLAACELPATVEATLPAVPFSCLHQRKVQMLLQYADEMGCAFVWNRKLPEYNREHTAIAVRKLQSDFLSKELHNQEAFAFDLQEGPQNTKAPPKSRRMPNDLVRSLSQVQFVPEIDWRMTQTFAFGAGSLVELNGEAYLTSRVCWQETENRATVRVLAGNLYQVEGKL
jgi:hypothetical protein